MPQVAVVNKAVVNNRAAAASQTWLPRACNLPRSAMSTYFDADGSAVVPRTSGVTSLVPVRAFVSFSHMRSPLRVRAPVLGAREPSAARGSQTRTLLDADEVHRQPAAGELTAGGP